MISSIPLIAPRDAHSLWYTPSRSFALTSSSSSPSTPLSTATNSGASQNFNPAELNASRTLSQNQPKRQHTISPLVQLALDEQALEQRKLNIQRFGATWLRPPGLPKTLQAELDERAEKEEALRLALMEAGDELLEAEDEDVERELNIQMQLGEEDDLDAQIPEAESFEGEDDGTEDDGEDLDAEIPEAELDNTSWDESDQESGSSENADESDDDLTQLISGISRFSNRPSLLPSSSIGIRTDSSPQQPMFSHDERFGLQDSRARADIHEYSRRYASAAIREADEMEVDSDG